jgi:hypothetical protein
MAFTTSLFSTLQEIKFHVVSWVHYMGSRISGSGPRAYVIPPQHNFSDQPYGLVVSVSHY